MYRDEQASAPIVAVKNHPKGDSFGLGVNDQQETAINVDAQGVAVMSEEWHVLLNTNWVLNVWRETVK